MLGLAADGDWWALGLRRPDASLLLGVTMSTDSTGSVQQARLAGAGLCVALLPVLTYVDDAGTAHAVAAQCPTSRFAAVLSAMVTDAPAVETTGTDRPDDLAERVTV